MSDLTKDDRRRYTNIHVSQLVNYRLPLAGIVSIMHRISGAFLFLSLPGLLWLFKMSLTSEISFSRFKLVTSGWFAKILILAAIAAYLFHLCAGIRHLFMDLHIGIDKEAGKRSAAAALTVSGIFTFVIALKLFGAF